MARVVNTDVYPYTDDETLGIIPCRLTMWQTFLEGGNSVITGADPSIFCGTINGSLNPLQTVFATVGFYRPTVEGTEINSKFSGLKVGTVSKISRKFGLAINLPSYMNYQAVNGTYNMNGGYGHINADSAGAFTSFRDTVNGNGSQRYRRLYAESIGAIDDHEKNAHSYKPICKIIKGQVCFSGHVRTIQLPADGFADWTASQIQSYFANNTVWVDVSTYKSSYSGCPILAMGLVGRYAQTVAEGKTWRADQLMIFYEQDTMAENFAGSNGDGYQWYNDHLTNYYNDSGLPADIIGGNMLPTSSKSRHYYPPWVNSDCMLVFGGGVVDDINIDLSRTAPLAHNLITCSFGLDNYQTTVFEDKYYSTYNDVRYTTDIVMIHYGGSVDDLKTIITNMGFAYTENGTTAINGNLETNPDIYVPTYDSNGDIIPDLPSNDTLDKDVYANGGGDIQPNFDPQAPDTPEDEDEFPEPEDENPNDEKQSINMTTPTLATYGAFNRAYAISYNTLRDLSDYLWNTDMTTWSEIWENLKLVGENRLDAIINILMFPFAVNSSSNPEYIRIGRQTTNCNGYPINMSQTQVFDLGSCYCFGKYQNFLDYEPYTKAWLYVPFFGLFRVPLREFMYKNINIKMVVDLMTGSAQIVVYAEFNGQKPILYKNGVVGMQIPVTGRDIGKVVEHYVNIAKTTFSGIGQAVSGNYGGALGSAFDMVIQGATADGVPIESDGSASPQCGLNMPKNCYFLLERPALINTVPDYGQLIGYACCKSGLIGSFNGFSKFENVKLDFTNATDFEKSEIIRLLESGIYL